MKTFSTKVYFFTENWKFQLSSSGELCVGWHASIWAQSHSFWSSESQLSIGVFRVSKHPRIGEQQAKNSPKVENSTPRPPKWHGFSFSAITFFLIGRFTPGLNDRDQHFTAHRTITKTFTFRSGSVTGNRGPQKNRVLISKQPILCCVARRHSIARLQSKRPMGRWKDGFNRSSTFG